MSQELLSVFFIVCQILYFGSFLVMIYFLTRKVNWVDMSVTNKLSLEDCPKIILIYPVLKELEETMRTTMLGLSKMHYPRDRFRVIALPNWNDGETIASLRRLVKEFPFLELMIVPPTNDPSWELVWEAWSKNPKAYWFHQGKYQAVKDLPPKKTRQLIWVFYNLVNQIGTDWLLDYIDADSVPPTNHFLAAAVGMKEGFDVLQSTNVAGNLIDTWAASFHSMDHMAWDGFIYPHMSADGDHPFWVLGKGLFYKASDLFEIGGFNPWITIEDPEVGMRLWQNGKKIGMIKNPLIEEVPLTIKRGIIQRKRWVCGFFQSLNSPLNHMGMSFWRRMQARLNLIPTLFLLVNTVGLPIGVWALIQYFGGTSPIPPYWVALSIVNIAAYLILITFVYANTWNRTGIVCKKQSSRIAYMLRVNPIFLWVYWLIWCVPIVIGFVMFLFDKGKVWQRTEKLDRNHKLVRGSSDR